MRAAGKIRLGEFPSPPEQAHGDKENGKKRTPEFRSVGRRTIEYGTVPIIATEETCLLTLVSVSNSVNVYGLWLNVPPILK